MIQFILLWRICRVASVLLLFSLCCHASQSVALTGGAIYSGDLPANGSFTSVKIKTQSMRWEARIHNWTATSGSYSQTVLFNLGVNDSIYCGIGATGILTCVDWMDAAPGVAVDISGLQQGSTPDVVFTFTRDTAQMRLYLVACNVGLSNCVSSVQAVITSLGNGPSPYTQPSSINIGAANTSADMAWLRWRTGTGNGLNNKPRDTDPAADLGDWEFEGNGNDSSGNGTRISIRSATYLHTPTYPPSCVAGAQRSTRAGFPMLLDGTGSISLNGTPTLSYFWTQLPGNNLAVWTSKTASQPSLTGLSFGPYTIQLTVTDTSGQSSTCSVKHGAVATDNNNIVIIPNPAHANILGQTTQWNQSPWPFFEDRNKAFADLIMSQLNTSYTDYWNKAGPGTITVKNGSPIVTGVATTFQTTFCGGSGKTTPGPGNNVQLMVWYPSKNYPGTTGRRGFNVVSCDSDTQMHVVANATAVPNYYTTACCVGDGAGLNYNYSDDSLIGPWIFSAAPANYYDNVQALYAMYYRTGVDDYLNAARTLADRWWRSPFMDRGAPYDGASGIWGYSPRAMSMGGLYMRALDNPPEQMWTGFRVINDYYINQIPFDTASPAGYGDVREESYEIRTIALCALYDPDVTPKTGARAFCQQHLNNVFTNRVVPYHQPAGNWRNFIGYGITSWDYRGLASSSITVQTGSTTVVGTGATGWSCQTVPCIWASGQTFAAGDNVTYGGSHYISKRASNIANQPDQSPTWWTVVDGTETSPTGLWMWIADTGNITLSGDPTGYHPTLLDPTHILLDKPYQKAGCTKPCSGRGFHIGPQLVGPGTQPFMMGVASSAMYLAAQALSAAGYTANATLARQYLDGIAAWMKNVAYQPSTKGLYYGRDFVDCEPNPDASPVCGGEGGRALAAEAVNAIAIDRLNGVSYDPSLDAFANLLYNAMYCTPTQACSDGTYLSMLDNGQYGMTGWPWKWFGLFFGIGGGWQWPAARLGGLAPPNLQTVYVPFTTDGKPNAAQVRITVTHPSGVASPPVVCSASPCAIQVDARAGSHLIRTDYLNSSGAVVASGETIPLYVPQ